MPAISPRLAVLMARRAVLKSSARTRRRPPPQLQPDAIRRAYFAAVRGAIGYARELELKLLVPELQRLATQAAAERADSATRLDESTGEVNRLVDEISDRWFAAFPNERLARLAETFGRRTADFQRAQLSKQFQAKLGIDVVGAEPWLGKKIGAFAGENVALIKSVAQRHFSDIETKLVAGLRSGQRWEDLAQTLQDRYGVAESSAKLVARDQVGKLFGDVNKVRQKQLGVTSFVWRTMEDNRVRDEHELLDGKTFAWDDPPDEGIPGEAINCRCFADPILDEGAADEAAAGTGGSPSEAPAAAPESSTAEELAAVLEPPPEAAPAPPAASAPASWEPAATLDAAVEQLQQLTGAKALAGDEYKAAGKRFGRSAFVLSRQTVELQAITSADRVSYMNRVGTTVADLKTRFPSMAKAFEGQDIRFLPGPSKSDGMFAYSQNARTKVNTTPFHLSFGPLSGEGYAKQMADYQAKRGVRWTVGGNAVEANVRHELGHLVEDVLAIDLDPLVAEIRSAAGVRGDRVWLRQNVSEYGATSTKEAFAELVGKVTDPAYQMGTLPAPIEKFILSALGLP